MEESKGEVKHVMLAKFKEGVDEEQIEECINQFSNLVNLVPSMKAFKWGKELGIANFHQGFTHIFESIFESAEGVVEYISNPHHDDFAKKLLPHLEKFVSVDFELKKG